MRPPDTSYDIWIDRLFSIITPPAVWAILVVIFAARFWRRLRYREVRPTQLREFQSKEEGAAWYLSHAASAPKEDKR